VALRIEKRVFLLFSRLCGQALDADASSPPLLAPLHLLLWTFFPESFGAGLSFYKGLLCGPDPPLRPPNFVLRCPNKNNEVRFFLQGLENMKNFFFFFFFSWVEASVSQDHPPPPPPPPSLVNFLAFGVFQSRVNVSRSKAKRGFFLLLWVRFGATELRQDVGTTRWFSSNFSTVLPFFFLSYLLC